MDRQKAKKKIEELSLQIEEHNHKYYVQSQPTISDKEYDDMLKSLIELENEFPEFRSPNSPSQRIGSDLPQEARAIRHKAKMYSLDNTYSIDEVKEWASRVSKGLNGEKSEYTVELKIDGVSVALTYENGEFSVGATRGDGIVGEDVTQNMRTIGSIPLKLAGKKNIPSMLEVRGEIYMYKKSFAKLNQYKKEKGEALFANPRNATSGSVKLLDSRITAKRELNCFIHSFGIMEGSKAPSSQWEFLQTVKKYGFNTDKNSRLCKTIDDVIKYCLEYQEKREDIPYEVDGVVIKVNSILQQQKLGSTMKSPRWAVAYKFPAKQATTEVLDIKIGVGRTGVLTPAAVLRPVECAGVIISNATLHNFDEVKRLGIKVGDTVLIERAGDVIPKVVKVVEPSKDKKTKEIKPPKKCPVCSSKIIKEKADVVAYKCINPGCRMKREKKIIHFCSRGAMDIEGLGEAVVAQLLDYGLVKDISDIYLLKKEDLLSLDLFADKKADNLINAIEKSKKQPLSRLLFALGIDNVGEKASYVLAQKFGNIDNLMRVGSDQIEEIDDIGKVISDSLKKTFNSAMFQQTIIRLKKAGVNMVEPKAQVISDKFQGKKFIFTGELDAMSRKEAGDRVKQLGGDVVSSVSKNIDYVVVGNSPGSKYQKAVSLSLNILNEKDFLEIINKK